MTCYINDENFTMKFDSGGKSSWPLPPSSVFKCRSAKPWISPHLFDIESHSQRGIMIVGGVSEEEVRQSSTNTFSINEDSDTAFSELIEVYGLPLPNSKIKAVTYSSNPEKGIDPGESGKDSETNSSTRSGPCLDSPKESDIESLTNQCIERQRPKGNHDLSIHNKNGSQQKRKWSPFSKDKSQSWRLFY